MNGPMNNNYKLILLKLLDAIDYADDKDAFVTEFMHVISTQALVNLLQTLPEDKQQEADKNIASAEGQENFNKAVSEYFADEQVAKAVDEASQKAILEWLRSLHNTLNDEQRKKLVELSNELQTQMEKSSK